jgi:hypothetical protein
MASGIQYGDGQGCRGNFPADRQGAVAKGGSQLQVQNAHV